MYLLIKSSSTLNDELTHHFSVQNGSNIYRAQLRRLLLECHTEHRQSINDCYLRNKGQQNLTEQIRPTYCLKELLEIAHQRNYDYSDFLP